MKKVFMGLSLFMGMMLFSMNVYAASFEVNIVGNNTFEDEITLNVQVDSLIDFSDTCDGLCGLVGTLEYDSNKIELISMRALEDFDLTQGSRIVLYRTTGVKSGTEVLSVTFKNKSLKDGESTTISFSDLTASDGDQDISTTDASITLQYVENNEDVTVEEPNDDNNESDNNQSENNSSNTNQSTNNNHSTNNQGTNNENTDDESSNNNLENITLSEGVIDFQEDILVYDVIVGNDVEEITIRAQLADSNASLSGAGVHALEVGNNEIVLVVTAEDGSEKEYILNIYREEVGVPENDSDENTTNEVSDTTQDEDNTFSIIPILIVAGLIVLIVVIVYVFKKKRSVKE